MRYVALLALFASSASYSFAAISVVGTDHTRLISGEYDLFSTWHTIEIDQTFEASLPLDYRDFTGFSMESNLIDFSFDDEPYGLIAFTHRGGYLDEGVTVFFVDVNDELSESKILNGDFDEFVAGSFFTTSDTPTLDPIRFFLGFRTPSLKSGYGGLGAYGWAEFEHLALSGLTLIDHAVAYHSEGIIVGSTVAIVPEPVSSTLALTAVRLASARRRL